MDNTQIEEKLKELDLLKKKVEKIISLNDIGGEIRDELEKEMYGELKSKGVDIRHLDKKYEFESYRKHDPRQYNKKVLTETEVKEALERAGSALGAARILGVSYPTFKRRARDMGIHKTPGWPVKKKTQKSRGPISPFKGKFPLDEILQNKHPNFPAHRLKDKLIRGGVKSCECEQCGFSERRLTDGKVPLLLNFNDGNNNNFLIENLRILCYNCTFTSGKGYISRGPDFSKYFDPDVMQGSKKIIDQRF